MPRHPPFALDNLTTENKDARVHCAILNQRPTHNPQPSPTKTPRNNDQPAGSLKRYRKPGHAWHWKNNHPAHRPTRLFFQIPNRMLNFDALTSRTSTPFHQQVTPPRTRFMPAVAGSDWPVSPPVSTPPPHSGSAGYCPGFPGKLLLRKEVIQPHLPVRLPCYDFVPIASPTFDGSLPYGLGHRLRVLPTFVT